MVAKKKAVKKKIIKKDIPKYKLKLIKEDFENGYPISHLSLKHDVDKEKLISHINKTSWKRKVSPVVREMSDAELKLWDKIIEETGGLDEGYRVLVFESLMHLRPSYVELVETYIKKQIEFLKTSNRHFFINDRPGFMMEVLEVIKGLNSMMENQFNMVSVTKSVDGDNVISPLQIVYNGKHKDVEEDKP